MSRGWNWLGGLAFLFVALAVAGFVAYAAQARGYRAPPPEQAADAIIVLTGDIGRLATGAQLLREGRADRLLITGVHPSATTADISRTTGLSEAEIACCVTLGREAIDTVGNARETGALVQENRFQSLIIVTSDYHLPRSLLEMKAMMPGVELIPYPVRTSPPWRDARAARLWLQEYAKFVAVWVGKSRTPRAGDAA